MPATKQLTPERFAHKLYEEGLSVGEIVAPYCSRSRGYQILKKYKEEYPELFPTKKSITKEGLASYLESHTISETADYYDVSINTIRKRMMDFGVRKVPLKERITEESLERAVRQGKSDEEIADAYNCSIHTIMKLRYTYGIFRRSSDRSFDEPNCC